MATSENVKIILSVDPKNALTGLKKFQTGVKNGVSKMRANFNKLRGSLSGVVGTIGGFVGIYGLVRGLKAVTNASQINDDAQASLAQSLKNTGKFTEKTFRELVAYAGQLQLVTKFGDEVTISALAQLQQFADLDSKGLKRLIPTLLDFAAGMKMDVATAAQLMGKTIGSSTNALARYGVEVDATLPKGEKLDQLIKGMNEKFGGQSTIRSYEKDVQRLKNDFGDLLEVWGNFITRSEATSGIISALRRFIRGLSSDVENMGTNFGIIRIKGAKAFQSIGTSAKKLFNVFAHPINHAEYNAALDDYHIAFMKTADRMIRDLENKKIGFFPDDEKGAPAGITTLVEKSKEELAQIAEIQKLRITNHLEGLQEETALINLEFDKRVEAANGNSELIVELNIARVQELQLINEKYTKTALEEAKKLAELEGIEVDKRKQAETDLYLFKVETGRITLQDHISNLEKSLDADKLTAIKRLQIEDELSTAKKELWEKENKDRKEREETILATLREGYDIYWQALTNGEMNRSERAKAIQLGLERMIISSIGKQLKAYLFTETTKEGVSKATTLSIVADNAIQFVSGLKTASADMLGSIAKSFKAHAGIPFIGVALGAVAGAALMALFQGFKGDLGFQEGGFTGQGKDNEIAGFVHKNEFVIPANVLRGLSHGGPRSTIVFNPQINTFSPTETRRLIRDKLFPEFKEIMRNGSPT